MCSHYIAETSRAKLARFGINPPETWVSTPGGMHIYPTKLAPVIRRPRERDSGDEAVPKAELVLAHFGLLPHFAKEVKYGLRTYNSRSETAPTLASFKSAWSKSQHCIIPASAIYESDWRTGKFVPTRVSRADGETLGIAGLWSDWRAPTGEWHASFTMLTLNADTHPIFKELHRPDPKREPSHQDKRMVVILNEDSYDNWLDAPVEKSAQFLRQYPGERLEAKAELKP